MQKKIAVTKMGILHSLANNVDAFWRAIKDKKSIAQTKIVDALALDLLQEDQARRMDRSAHLLSICVKKMLYTDNHNIPFQPEKTGICTSTNLSSSDSILSFIIKVYKSGLKGATPGEYPNTAFNTCNGYASIVSCLKGYNNAIAGFGSLGEAYDALQLGRAQSMVAAGVEPYGDFQEMLYSSINRNRIISEGAASLLLTSDPETDPVAWYSGYHANYDAGEFNQCQPDGNYLSRTMTGALEKNGLSTDDVDGVVLSTALFDRDDQRHTRALHNVFGERLSHTPLYHLETITGYTGAAAECLAAMYACLLLHRGKHSLETTKKTHSIILAVVTDQFGCNVAHLFRKT